MAQPRKTPIVMLHGAFCGGWALDDFRRPFEAAGHQVLTPDLRHHTRTAHQEPDPALGTTSLLDYAADLEALLLGLDEDPILMGHSLGGLLAQMLAARGHGRALVLLAPSPPWGVLPSTTFEVLAAQGLFFLGGGTFWEQPLWPNYHITAEHALDRLPPRVQASVFARFGPESGRAMFETLHWPTDPMRTSTVHARDVRCPVLCMAGTDDRVNPPATVRRIATRYRERATYWEWPSMSHWLIGEPGWETVAQQTARWLTEHGLDEALGSRRHHPWTAPPCRFTLG